MAEITSFARNAGVDPVKEPIPVQPTCHYMMGGIATDADGRVVIDDKNTPYAGLYAAGECAGRGDTGQIDWAATPCSTHWSSGGGPVGRSRNLLRSAARPELPAKPDKRMRTRLRP